MARLATLAALAAAAAALLTAPAHARPGDVDATFGVGGQAVFAPQGTGGSTARGLSEQADGKLLVSGFGWSGGDDRATAILLRLNENGGLDRTFGDQGIVRSVMRFSAADSIVLGDGRIVLVGDMISGSTSTTPAAVRLLPDGRPDASFGNGGLATVPGGDPGPATIWGAILQSDGRLVLLGQADPPGSEDGWGTVAVRLMPDGSLDKSFGSDGWSRLEVPNSRGLAYLGEELAGGKLLIAGEFDRTDTQGPDYNWTLLRLQPDGSKDTTFDDDGVAQGYFTGQGGTFGDLAVQPDGRILISGAGIFDGRHGWGIARAMPDGKLDPSFGDGGRVAVHPPGSDPSNPLIGGVDGLALQEDGRIVVSGNRSGVFRGMELVSGWALARLMPDGSPDGDFGEAGWSATAMGFGNRLWPSGLVRTRDGKVVMSGDANDCGQGTISVVRFHAENADAGTPDAGPAMRTCDPVVEAEPDGDLPIDVQCPLTEDVCRGTGEVEIPSADLPVGRKSFKLSGAHRGTLRIRASRRARRLIARPRGVRAEIVYRTKDGDGHRKVTRRKLRLKRG